MAGELKKVITVDVYQGKNVVKNYGFMAGDKNTPVMEVTFKDTFGTENLEGYFLRYILIDNAGSLIADEVVIEPGNKAIVKLPNELFEASRKIKVQLAIVSADDEQVANINYFVDSEIRRGLAEDDFVEPVYQLLLDKMLTTGSGVYKEITKLSSDTLSAILTQASIAKGSLEQYLITAENGGNAEFVQGYTPSNFNRVEATMSALINSAGNKYKVGDVVEVLGYYEQGDGAHHKRKIESTDDGSGVQLSNGLWANIVHSGEVNVSWFGAKGDGVADDSNYFVKLYNYSKAKIKKIDKTLNLNNISIKLIGNITFLNLKAKLTNCKPLFTTENCSSTIYNFELRGKTELTTEDNSQFLISKDEAAYKPIVSMICDEIVTKCRFELYGWNTRINKFQSSEANETPLVLRGNLYELGQVYILKCAESPLDYKAGYSTISNLSTEHNAKPIIIGGGQLSIDSMGAEYQQYLFCFSSQSNNSKISVKSVITYNMTSPASYVLNESEYSNSITFENCSSAIQTAVLNNSSGNVEFRFLGSSVTNHRVSSPSTTIIKEKTLANSENFVVGRLVKNLNSANVEGYENTSIALGRYSLGAILDPGEVIHIPFFPALSRKFAFLKLSLDLTVLRHSLPHVNKKLELSVYFNYGENSPYYAFTNTSEELNFFVETIDDYKNFQMLKIQNIFSYPIYIDFEILQTANSYDNKWNYEYFSKNFSLGTTTYVLTNNVSYELLDTPYYTTKMQIEGIYDDYISYRDELHLYEQEQKLIEQQRQEAYQQALEENPELSYEDWLSTRPMALPIAEPQPSKNLIAFKEKWLG